MEATTEVLGIYAWLICRFEVLAEEIGLIGGSHILKRKKEIKSSTYNSLDMIFQCVIDSKITSRINISLTISLHRYKGIRKQMSYYFKFILDQN